MRDKEQEFLMNVSHELRTPLTILRGFAEILRDGFSLTPETTRDIATKMVDNCDRLEKLVHSLLVLADAQQLSVAPCDLISLLEQCKGKVQTLHPHTNITLQCPAYPLFIDADRHLLEIALMNLLENGVKYSTSPAKIAISIEKCASQVHCAIRDRGFGIPPSDLPHIFERFYTVDKTRSRKMGGVGLGLAIVKAIVDKHRGAVEVTSELGRGSTFTMILQAK